MLSVIDTLQRLERAFEKLYTAGLIPLASFNAYLTLYWQGRLDRAVANFSLALDSMGAKRAIYLEMPEGETTPVSADPERIGQVLSNFLSNALKYSQEGRPVVVRLKKEENMVRVSVQDEGPGLTPSEQEQVWERFYQVEGIQRQRGSSVGLGLGLYICRAIIEQHQGQIGVESTKGEGSTFWFTLPLTDPDD